jgi:hypothetical protein
VQLLVLLVNNTGRGGASSTIRCITSWSMNQLTPAVLLLLL